MNPSVCKITLWTYAERGEITPLEFNVYFATVLHELGFTVNLEFFEREHYFALIEGPGQAVPNAGLSGYCRDSSSPVRGR
ncbi:MAG: hypothetical protein JSU06_13065 [Actinobacteria bacterium]|nr:hypothetical protein [Actinomycetota bacterium]